MNFRSLIPYYNKREPKEYNYTFTVFTPVFNCESTIGRVHKSLLNQTYTNFEWLIINDGSTDESHKVISSILKKTPLQVRYINNIENQHKMGCFMQAIELANGEFFLTFDADDECVENALEVFKNEYDSIPNNLKPKTSAVTGLCVNQRGESIGDSFPYQPYYSNTFESYAVANILGEKWGFTKTNVLRNISYSKAFISNGFMPEGLIWNLLSKQGFKTKYINIPLRIYYTDIDTSISASNDTIIALGSATEYIANFNWFFKTHAFQAPLFFIKNLYFLLRISKYLDFNLKNYTTSMDSYLIKFFFVLLWPIRKHLK